MLELPGVPVSLLHTVQLAAKDCGITRLCLVGGAVRDALLHHVHRDPWHGLSDLDFVVEGSAEELAFRLRQICGEQRVSSLRVYGSYGTVEMVLDGVMLDFAGARQEHYPQPAFNPVVQLGSLETDLARRDFTVNALALELPLDTESPKFSLKQHLFDNYAGQWHLANRLLFFLHHGSVRDDPTRVIRAARYAARLGFTLAPEAEQQITDTLAAWPWSWRAGIPPELAPPALATRLRMELELLLLQSLGQKHYSYFRLGEVWSY